jgi:vesicular inhibitory amino acid transporter
LQVCASRASILSLSLSDPQALLLSFSIAAASMLALGLAGAAMFGRRTRSQVTLSMPLHLASTKVVLWSTVVTPIFKFALQLSPITAALDAQLCRHGRSFDHKAAGSSSSSSSSPMFALLRILLRSSVLAAIVVGSLLFPYFQYVAALIGSSMTISICLIFPCIFYLKLFWRRLGRRSVAAVSALLLFGVLVAACGTAVALQGLIHSKRKHAS